MSAELYTTSKLKVLRSCLRKYQLRYHVGIRGPESMPMRFGTQGHAALEAWLVAAMNGATPEERLAAALDAITLVDPIERARLVPLIAGYHARWIATPWKVLAVEAEFRYELAGFLVGGKIDAVVQDEADGRVYVLEHKTAGGDTSHGSAYWEKLRIDTQISIYVDGATALGFDVAGVIYDVLQRPKHEPKLATADIKLTQGKGCKLCGGKAGKPGRGATPSGLPCAVCFGSGWARDGEPKPYANQRLTDETVEEFTERVAEAICAAPDEFYKRGVVVRTEDELPKMRTDLVDEIKLARAAELFGLFPRNPDACAAWGQLCHMFPICSGAADQDDEIRFPRGSAHPELAAT